LLAERGVELSSGRQIVSAALADPSLARHLQIVVGAALIYIRRFHYDQLYGRGTYRTADN